MQALHSAETSQRFNNELNCLLGDLDGSGDISQHWNNIKSSLHTAAEKILGEPEKQNKPWISHETLALIDKRSRARTKLSKAKLRREIKKAVRADKARYYSELADEVIAADESGNTRKMYSLIKKISGIGPTTTDILKDEILLALHKLKNKAGGIDALPPELFRRGAPSVFQPLQELFALVWLHQKIPDDWNIAVIPCYKKGDKAKCSNYRGISLIAIALKVLEAVIKNRLELAYTKAARINQASFKKSVACRDQVLPCAKYWYNDINSIRTMDRPYLYRFQGGVRQR